MKISEKFIIVFIGLVCFKNPMQAAFCSDYKIITEIDENYNYIDTNSSKSSIDTMYSHDNDEKQQNFLKALQSHNSQDLIAMLEADARFRENSHSDQESPFLESPFYVTDHKKDLIAIEYNMPIDVYHNLMALGGGLTKEEYVLLQNFELQEIENNVSIEQILREQFVQAIMNKNIDRLKSLIDIDQCLRYQDFLNHEYRLKKPPLMQSCFDQEMTPLHLAVQANSPELVDFFIKNGLSVNALAQIKRADVQEYRPQTPLDFALVYREKIKKTDDTPSVEFDRNRQIIDELIASKAETRSADLEIQKLLHAYMMVKIKQPTAKRRLSVYQSMSNFLGSNAAKVSPI